MIQAPVAYSESGAPQRGSSYLTPKNYTRLEKLAREKTFQLIVKICKVRANFFYHLSLVRAAVKSFATQAQTAIRPRSAILPLKRPTIVTDFR